MSTTALPPQGPPPLSESQRLIDVLIAPTKTFTDLRRSASWWAPFLIIAIVSFLFIYVVDQRIGFRKVVENLIQTQPRQAERIENMPADQREKVMQQQVALTKIISYSAPVFALAIYAVFAGVLFGTVKVAGSAELEYKTMFALVLYARLPEVLRELLGIVSILAGVSGDGFNLQNPVAVNPGYFVDPSGSAVLRTLLTPIDVISFWTLILLAVGITYISKVKRATAFAIVFGWYTFVVLARTGLAAAF